MHRIYTQSHHILIYSVLILLISSCSNVSQDPWATLEPLPLDPAIEAQIDEILPKLTPEQKVGQLFKLTIHLLPRRCKKISFRFRIKWW